MQILFECGFSKRPLISIVLLDWSIRERCYILDCLNRQDVDRELYEIIWIEYYDRRLPEIELSLKQSASLGRLPPLNQWVVLNMPRDIYYHKHLMYNIGLMLSSGKIITFCDSDACLKATFIKSIIDSFKDDENIVLHMDELRNNNKKCYPLPPASLDEISGPDWINLVDGKPRGLVDFSDPLHLRNYGACMSALRRDLITIGGADEHIDYLGHICGPYEMTFRLINAGKREIWHSQEWLYHFWHPGQAGRGNYLGPHDGRHMSTTALEIIKSGRVMPLIENPAIRLLRLGGGAENFYASLLPKAVSEIETRKWRIDKESLVKENWLNNARRAAREWLGRKAREYPFLKNIISLTLFLFHPRRKIRKLMLRLRLKFTLFYILIKQFFIKASVPSRGRFRFINKKGGLRERLISIYHLLKELWEFDNKAVGRCRRCLTNLALQGIKEVDINVAGDMARILYVLSAEIPVKIRAFYDDGPQRSFLGFKVNSPETLDGQGGKIIVASLVNREGRIKRLKQVGVEEERIVTL